MSLQEKLDQQKEQSASMLPIPGRFIINKKGEIVDADYIQRPEPTEILTILKTV